ncbi:MAG: DUF2510 domain-containing protein [Acidimicrobiales bacterium]|jgi:hypothetical protein
MPALRRGKQKHDGKGRIVIEGSDKHPVKSRPGAIQPDHRLVAIPPLSEDEGAARRGYPDMSLAGYHADPTARHEFRFFDGGSWTANVVDGKSASIDPVASNGRKLPAPIVVTTRFATDA